ncbi:putative pentatricopeptide repeat-containing protein-like [Capsicum annuum]|nr:putative pentatricopeptide repeat-containing protein-like [Capsicum annuum]
MMSYSSRPVYVNPPPLKKHVKIRFTMAQNPKHLLQRMTPPPPTTDTSSENPKISIPIQSSSSSSLRVTRDLPNLSDCHGCGVRINHTDPDDRLQTLGSVWRIVLVCKKCIRYVNSGQACPYCFKDTDDDDSGCLKCSSRCKRLVHKDCISRYENSPPWSFTSSDQRVKSGKFVCIDCWVPSFFRGKSIGVCRKIEKYVSKTQNSTSDFKLRKVVLALKAKDSPSRKSVVAKNALKFVVKKDKNKGLLKTSRISNDDTNLTEVVNDAEFAFQLHRSMNSSPRISRTLCPRNSSYVGGPENVSCKLLDLGQTVSNSAGERLKVYSRTRYRGNVVRTSPETLPCVMVYSRTRLKEKVGQTSSEAPPSVAVYSRTRLKEKVGKDSSDASPCVMVYSRTRLKEKVCQPTSEAPPCVTMNERDPCVDSAHLKAELLTYKRNRLKRKMCKERVGLSGLIKEELDLGDDCRDLSGLKVSQLEGSQHNLHLQDASTLGPLSSGGDNTVQGEFCTNYTVKAESYNTQQDHFLLKYSRKKKRSAPGADVNEESTPDRSIPTNWFVESRSSSNC